MHLVHLFDLTPTMWGCLKTEEPSRGGLEPFNCRSGRDLWIIAAGRSLWPEGALENWSGSFGAPDFSIGDGISDGKTPGVSGTGNASAVRLVDWLIWAVGRSNFSTSGTCKFSPRPLHSHHMLPVPRMSSGQYCWGIGFVAGALWVWRVGGNQFWVGSIGFWQ